MAIPHPSRRTAAYKKNEESCVKLAHDHYNLNVLHVKASKIVWVSLSSLCLSRNLQQEGAILKWLQTSPIGQLDTSFSSSEEDWLPFGLRDSRLYVRRQTCLGSHAQGTFTTKCSCTFKIWALVVPCDSRCTAAHSATRRDFSHLQQVQVLVQLSLACALGSHQGVAHAHTTRAHDPTAATAHAQCTGAERRGDTTAQGWPTSIVETHI
eukprot:1162070-Pelagomonas_calceolata.AAC.11